MNLKKFLRQAVIHNELKSLISVLEKEANRIETPVYFVPHGLNIRINVTVLKKKLFKNAAEIIKKEVKK